MLRIDDTFDQRAHWIYGQLSPSRAAEDIAVVNPASEQIVGHVAAGDTSDVDRAVQAANRAFPSWRDTPLGERLAFADTTVRHT
jgi:aldehyde dehydrogenase (NAD+)